MSPPHELKERFDATLGKEAWNDGWKQMLRFSPEAFEACLKLHAVPRKKKYLSPKVQCLVALAVDCASTHLYTPGIREKVTAALAADVTVAEIIEVIELTATLGIHACNVGVPLLVEVMKEQGVYESHPSFSDMDQRRKRLQAEFTKNRGYWHTFWEDFWKLDPEFFEAYLEFSSVPWLKDVNGDGNGGGALEPKVSARPPFSTIKHADASRGERVGILRF